MTVPMDEFEEAIRRVGVTAACEWFGHAHDSDFTRETTRILAERQAEKNKQVRYMDIYSRYGTQVIFHAQGGYEGDKESAKKVLEVGKQYSVRRTEVSRSSSVVYLIGYTQPFNTVMFGPAE